MRALGPLVLGSVLAASAAVPDAAAAPDAARKSARFYGAHPIAAPRGGYCYIDAPHSHDYAPDRPVLYQEAGDGYVFTGDPVPFGYDGEKVVYYGHHPVPAPVDAVPGGQPVFCFIKGPHYHGYRPPEPTGYKTRDNVVFYVGPFPPEIARQRPQQERLLEAEYRPYVAQRPQVVVTPPPEWQGPVWVAPPPVAVVAPAPVEPVVAPAPGPAVVVAPARPVVVAPAPPAVPVVIGAPPIPTVVVTPPAPAVIVAPHPGVVVVPGRGHPGKHKGWFKRGKW